MRKPGSAHELESKRRTACRMRDQNYTSAEVAEALDVSVRSVDRWHKAWREYGEKAVAAKPNPGRPSRLTARQLKQLTTLLRKGPLKAGFPTDLWTCPRIAQVIERRFAVTYDPSHVWRLLHRLGWSCQTPQHQPRQQNQDAVERWVTKEMPRIKKGASRSS